MFGNLKISQNVRDAIEYLTQTGLIKNQACTFIIDDISTPTYNPLRPPHSKKLIAIVVEGDS